MQESYLGLWKFIIFMVTAVLSFKLSKIITDTLEFPDTVDATGAPVGAIINLFVYAGYGIVFFLIMVFFIFLFSLLTNYVIKRFNLFDS